MSIDPPGIPVWPFARKADAPLIPPPQLAELRSTCPIAQVELWDGSYAWLATRYHDVKALLRNPGLSSDTSLDGFPQSSETLKAARGAQKTFQRLDPPQHDVLRRMLTKDFSVNQIATLKPFIETLVDHLLDQIEAAGHPVDLVTALAEPLPAHVVCKILALPPDDFGFFLDRVGRFMALSSTPEQARTAAADIADYLAEVVTARKEDLADDLVSELIRKYLIPGALTEFELVHMLHLLVIGGFDTTANMIALGTILLLQNPGQMKDLREDPELIQGAVEEMLRYLSVAHHVAFRLAKADIEISDICIHAGEGVIAPINAANHDPEVFPDPQAFDVRRDARDHVAFGFGVHQCLGQHLARLELQVVFTKLLRRFPTLRLEAGPADLHFKDSMIYGVERCPVSW